MASSTRCVDVSKPSRCWSARTPSCAGQRAFLYPTREADRRVPSLYVKRRREQHGRASLPGATSAWAPAPLRAAGASAAEGRRRQRRWGPPAPAPRRLRSVAALARVRDVAGDCRALRHSDEVRAYSKLEWAARVGLGLRRCRRGARFAGHEPCPELAHRAGGRLAFSCFEEVERHDLRQAPFQALEFLLESSPGVQLPLDGSDRPSGEGRAARAPLTVASAAATAGAAPYTAAERAHPGA